MFEFSKKAGSNFFTAEAANIPLKQIENREIVTLFDNQKYISHWSNFPQRKGIQKVEGQFIKSDMEPINFFAYIDFDRAVVQSMLLYYHCPKVS